jgi:hypothetical protein
VLGHGNGTRALGALGGLVGSRWHGRGGVHGRSRAGLARGIGPWVQCETGGEVTARGVVGGVLPMRHVHGGRGGALGEREVDERCLYEVGSGEGSSRSGDRPLGVGGGVDDRSRREGEGFWAKWPRATPSSSTPSK